MNFPRYKPKPARATGASAFTDFVLALEQRDAGELKSCRVNRQWRKKGGAERLREIKETDPVE